MMIANTNKKEVISSTSCMKYLYTVKISLAQILVTLFKKKGLPLHTVIDRKKPPSRAK
jgi:hypothetical protein